VRAERALGLRITFLLSFHAAAASHWTIRPVLTPALPLSLGIGNGLVERHETTTSCSCHPPQSVTQPVRLRVLRPAAYPTVHPPPPSTKHHPPPTAFIAADASCSNWAHQSEYWPKRLNMCIITTSPSNERRNGKVAAPIAPKNGDWRGSCPPRGRIQVEWPAGRAAGGS
jgi:hypothetical protein